MRKLSFWYRLLIMVLVLVLVVPLLAGCDDDDDDDKTTQPAAVKTTQPDATTAPAKTTAPAPTDSDKPVKIGYILDWTGPAAMAGFLADGVIAFAEWYTNEKRGGVIDGRPLKIIKGDDKSQAAQGSAMAIKLITSDHVSGIAGGGVVEAVGYAVADVTDPANMTFSTLHASPELFDDYKWTIGAVTVWDVRAQHMVEWIVSELHPKTVGFLSNQTQKYAQDLIQDKIEALDPDIKTVYYDLYAEGTTDFSPYLTKIKYEEPDVLVLGGVNAYYASIAGQIPNLGGLGNTKVFSAYEAALDGEVTSQKGSDRWYSIVVAYEGQESFDVWRELWDEKCAEDSDFNKKYGALPALNTGMILTSVLTLVDAIRLAGTDDPAKVAEAARSGNLVVDAPIGDTTIGKDGKCDRIGVVVQIQDGKAVPME